MFRVSEILKATGGKLIKGDADGRVSGISTDSRTINEKEAFIAIKGEKFDGHDFIGQAIAKGAVAAIISRSQIGKLVSSPLKVALIEVSDTVRALGDLARYQRKKLNLPVVAVTGSNGKTTTKDMIAHILSDKYRVLKNSGTRNNHIGLPQTLLTLGRLHDIAVLELGTNHPGEIDYLAQIALANIGIITNIGPAHLEFLKDLKGVFREKTSLLAKLQSPAIAIINADDALLKKIAFNKSVRPAVFSFSLVTKGDFMAAHLFRHKERVEFTVNKKYKFTLKTAGYYNVYNALAAIAVGRIFGIGYAEIIRQLRSFDFPEGRFRFKEIKGINFIDDTYNANPLSLKSALETIEAMAVKGRKIFIMGDMLELGKASRFFHRSAGRYASSVCDVFIAVGRQSRYAAQEAKRAGLNKDVVFTCDSPFAAKHILLNTLSPTKDDIVLVKGSRMMSMEEVLKI
ncbi:MAG: UDP-N-acetylmuramoyl-tripeptide--D-alanyl-D-alanine ligase [Candidatus Omnitrophica bacterium]|nr:UDP-N-acetylmuramoyl-tripeptide--D-alanyl-D-alanine ligase [Candidatus Omnitrophota bacterium]